MPQNNSTSGVDLAQLFGAVAQNLMTQREDLNKADTYNNDHGDNMVQTFETIAKAVQQKQSAPPAEQLAYAGDTLRKVSKSGSAQAYAEGLLQASQQLNGQNAITSDNVNVLLQSLLGGGVAPQQQQQQAQPSGGGDLLGALLGGLTGGGQAQSGGGDAGLDMGDLLNAGMAFMNAKQQGQSNMEAALGAVLAASPLGASSHRQQSSSVVANTIMQMFMSK